MTDPFAALTVNPFEDDAVRDPRAVTYSVKGLNEQPLETLLARFDQLTADKLPRPPQLASKAQLVVSPDAGYGKSHLLGRLFQALGDRATQIYIRPFQNPDRAWNSILLTTVQELNRPSRHTDHARTQLEAFGLGVLAHVVADQLESGGVRNLPGLQEAVDDLRSRPLEAFAPSSPNRMFVDWLRKDGDELKKLAGLVKRRCLDLDGHERAWLQVLSAYAFTAEGSAERAAALAWLRADPLDEDELEALKLRTADNDAPSDGSARDINDISLRRLQGLCALASYYRPFLFCFDQTEFYGSDPALVAALGNCIEELFAALPNHLTIVTANASNWSHDIRPHLPPAIQNRFSFPIELDGINEKQGDALIGRRLEEFNVGDEDVAAFIERSWLHSSFKGQSHIGVRRLLMAAAERFRVLARRPQPPRASMDELFAVEVNKVRAKAALQEYNQNSLMWFTEVLARDFAEVNTGKTSFKYFTVRWHLADRLVYFGFEGGAHHLRWKRIAEEAIKAARDAPTGATTVVFRTPDLVAIPRPTWRVVGQTLADARKSGLCIVVLTVDDVCELHAAREFYSNALQGNIDCGAADVLHWLKRRFVPWFEKYSRPDDGSQSRQERPPASPPPMPAAKHGEPKKLTVEQGAAVVTYVQTYKLVDIKDVLRKFGLEKFKDALLRLVEKHPNLKAHEGPQTIYLQWRAG